MAEYFEREALLDSICHEMCGIAFCGATNCAFMAKVCSAPSANVAPVVHGRWIYDKKAQCPYCSVCKEYFYGATNSPMSYCSNCGAKMDGGADHEAD